MGGRHDANIERLALIRQARKQTESSSRPVHLPLDEIVRRANLLQTPGAWRSLERMRMLGELVFRTLYEDDEDQWRILGSSHPDYRQLLAHPELKVSGMMLWRALHVRALFRRLPMLHDARHLGVSHVCAVIGLPKSRQEALLSQAEAERWSIRWMTLVVREQRRLEAVDSVPRGRTRSGRART